MTPKEIEKILIENELYPDGVYECVNTEGQREYRNH